MKNTLFPYFLKPSSIIAAGKWPTLQYCKIDLDWVGSLNLWFTRNFKEKFAMTFFLMNMESAYFVEIHTCARVN